MAEVLHNATTEHGGSRRALMAFVRAAPVSVRRWTGRSAMTLATDSGIPRVVTAGTRQTRVSAMRLLPARVTARPLGACVTAGAPSHYIVERRSLRSYTHQHRWSG